MMNLFSLFILIIFAGCASGEKKYSASDPYGLEDISDKDFIKAKPIKYIAGADFHILADSPLSALSQESAHHVDEDLLEKIMDSGDPLSRSIGLCYSKKHAEGVKGLQEIYPKYRRHPSFWNAMGICFYSSSDYRKAVIYFNKALEVHSKYAPAINNLGVVYLSRSLDQKALVAFKQASNMNRYAKLPLFNQLLLLLKYNLLDAADQVLLKMEKVQSKDPDIQNARAVWYMMKGQDKKAIQLFSLIDSDYIRLADFGLNYAIALKRTGDNDGSQNVFNDVDESQLGNMKDYYAKVKKFVKEGK